MMKGASIGDFGISLGCPQGASLWRFSGHAKLEIDPGKTQNSLEGLKISSSLGMPQNTPGGGKCCWEEGHLEYPA